MNHLHVKAARMLLDWRQAELARAADLSLTAVKSFEQGRGTTRARTAAAIRGALETGGIEFPQSGGVRLAEDVTSIVRFSGDTFVQSHNETIYATLRRPHSELLTCSVDDSTWWQHSKPVKAAHEQFQIWHRRLAINERILVPEGNTVFNIAKKQYRTLPPELIGKITYIIYADRISFIFWKKRQVFILRNSLIVDTFRKQFNYLWRLARPV